jgi:hypothetical protein
MWMAAFTRETQLGTSAGIIEMCRLDTTAHIVDLDLRSNPRQSVATILCSSTLSPSADRVVSEWKSYALVMDSSKTLDGGETFNDTRND